MERLLFLAPALRDARLGVEVANGIVTLSGQAPSQTTAAPPSTAAPALAAATPPPDADDEQVRRLLDESKREADVGNPNQAIAIVQRALKIQPTSARAREALQRLRNRPPRPQP